MRKLVSVWLCGVAALAACGGESSGSEEASGARLYRDHGCPLCHGPAGGGDGPLAATLTPRPRDLRDPASYDRGTSAADVARTLANGLPKGGALVMQPYPHIPEEDRLAIAQFVVSLQRVGQAVKAGLTVTGAWARATPPGSEMSGAYMTLHNQGSETVALRQVASSAARVVEIHRVVMAGGRMTMTALGGLEIAPGESVVLEPGGLHLMLIGLEAPLEVGQRLELELRPEGAPAVRVELPVRREAPVDAALGGSG